MSKLLILLIPFISAVLYLIGGQWWKPARWLIGLPIGLIYVLLSHSWIVIPLSTVAYWVATSAFPYGEKSWLNFLGEWGKFFVVGLVLGACSFILLPWPLAVLQTILSGISFVVIKYLDDKGTIHNPVVELSRGFFGTVLFLFK